MKDKKLGLRRTSVILLTTVFLMAASLFIAFDARSQQQQTEIVMAEEARTIAREMDAMWEFMDKSQDLINYSSDGDYDFKGLHCAIVGKSVSAIFSENSSYNIRYTNFTPRNIMDEPDAFESDALNYFLENPGTHEYFEVVNIDDRGVNEDCINVDESIRQFRYVQALEVDQSCLECHGEPAGEIDKTGNPKEGWTTDSLGGAISITMPMRPQYLMILGSLIRDVAFFMLLLTLIGGVVYLIVTYYVLRPLNMMEHSFKSIAKGNFDSPLDTENLTREMRDLIIHFNQMAAELASTQEHLEEQVESRTFDLRQANAALTKQRDELRILGEKLAQESQLKSDMLSMVNHELRTPLTSIIAISDASILASKDDEDKASWQAIKDNSKDLLSLINNMLDIAKNDAGKMRLDVELLDMGDVISVVKSTLAPLADSSHVAFRTSVAADVPLVCGDYDKLIRILENLGSNAIKFTPNNKKVVIGVSREKSSGDVLIKVVDQGIGIPEDKLDKIFERFYQVDSTPTRSYRGSGLGLPLVKDYAVVQGFKISVESRVGEGSVFTVRIPSSKTAKID